MLVEALGSRQVVSALRVGPGNVRQYFPKKIPSIELELDHLRIECKLTRDFWNHAAEIRDGRLCLWLRFKIAHARSPGTPVQLAMTPTGKNRYRLEFADLDKKPVEGEYFALAPELEWRAAKAGD